LNRRVVITGIGLVSSLGIGTEATWQALLVGTSGVTRVTRFDISAYAAQIAAEVKGFDPLNFVEKKDVKKMDVFIQYALAASQFAMDDSGLRITPANAPDVGVYIGSASAGFKPSSASTARSWRVDRGRSHRSSFLRPSSIWPRARSRSASAPRVRTWRVAPPARPRRTRSAIRSRSSVAEMRTS
jgi:3-oxoacyl-[acyl-carrier-protein] synthase II